MPRTLALTWLFLLVTFRSFSTASALSSKTSITSLSLLLPIFYLSSFLHIHLLSLSHSWAKFSLPPYLLASYFIVSWRLRKATVFSAVAWPWELGFRQSLVDGLNTGFSNVTGRSWGCLGLFSRCKTSIIPRLKHPRRSRIAAPRTDQFLVCILHDQLLSLQPTLHR